MSSAWWNEPDQPKAAPLPSQGSANLTKQSSQPINQSMNQQQNSTSSSSQAGPPQRDPPAKRFMKCFVIFIDIFLSTLISATGALGIGSSSSIKDANTIFVGLYLIFFSGILFFYECMQMCKCSAIDNIIKRNCGFLYGPFGKGCYLVFIAILTFGITDPKDLALGAGVVTILWGILLALMALAVSSLYSYMDGIYKLFIRFFLKHINICFVCLFSCPNILINKRK